MGPGARNSPLVFRLAKRQKCSIRNESAQGDLELSSEALEKGPFSQ
jgi:hypothetical protein